MGGKFRQTLLTWIGIFALFAGMQWFANRGLVEGAAPAIHGPTLDGPAFAGLESLPKPAVVYFWATWCGVCRAMRDNVLELNRDTPLITVALQSGTAAEVGAYFKQEGYTLPVVLDEDGAIGKSYGLRGVPSLFVLGPDGSIRYATAGYTSLLGLRLRVWLAGL